jgi:hypothetical protein
MGARRVKPAFLTVVAFLGTIAFLALFMADREMQAGVERLSRYTFSHPSTGDQNPDLRRASRRGQSTRSER